MKNTKKLPPMIHNLLSLASLAELNLTSEQQKLFALLNPLNIEARYLGDITKLPTKKQAQAIIKRAKAALEWLIEEL